MTCSPNMWSGGVSTPPSPSTSFTHTPFGDCGTSYKATPKRTSSPTLPHLASWVSPASVCPLTIRTPGSYKVACEMAVYVLDDKRRRPVAVQTQVGRWSITTSIGGVQEQIIRSGMNVHTYARTKHTLGNHE